MNYSFTYEQLLQIVARGIIPGEVPLALLNGNILKRELDTPEHDVALAHVASVLTPHYPTDTILVKHPLFLNKYTVVVPDLMVVRGTADYSPINAPTARDIVFVLELTTGNIQAEYSKTAIYARNSVNHYWILDTGKKSLQCLVEARQELARYSALRLYNMKERAPLLEIEPTTQIKVDKLIYKVPNTPKGPKPNGVPKADETAST
jgi:hypothetical protein